jgi:hypothetical protein
MDKFIITNELETAIELQNKGCKLLNEKDGIYTLVNCSNKINFSEFNGRAILTNKLKF